MAINIPTGMWSLWYHSPKENKWTPSTYKQVAIFTTWVEFWSLINLIGDGTITNGFFFFMKGNTPPLWENKANIRGGSYSMRVGRNEAFDTYIKYVIGAMVGKAAKSTENNINGITISPKKGFNIINVWNEDFNKGFLEDLNEFVRRMPGEEIRYTRHIDKKFN
jgi:hypothetical protein